MMNKISNIDCYPDKAQYFEGDAVKILLENGLVEDILEINITVSELENTLLTKTVGKVNLQKEKIFYQLELTLPVGNYGVDVKVRYVEKEVDLHTAFDIVDTLTSCIRYGFLTDFSNEDKLDRSDIEFANKLHLNALQFYDWMYRHDKLVAETLEYKEPLGRDISLQTIKNKISFCKEYGIRPFAYGAIYAASKEAYEEHPDWAFYKKNQETLTFADWLVFMDTSDNAPWCRHIIEEYAEAITRLGFQGIHMDTYGFPKYAWNSEKERVSLAETFSGMINKAKAAVKAIDEKAGVIFNAVNNWPVEQVAKSDQDAVYIEVWPPHVTYHHLYSLVREAKYLGAKNVILAAYIESFKDAVTEEDIQAAEISFLMTNAVIQASGGSQIVLGETNALLRDSYYVNYAVIREAFLPIVKSYCDFSVRYGKLLYDMKAMDISMTAVNGINTDIKLSVPADNNISFSSYGEQGKIWSIIRETPRNLTIQLINLCNSNELWNQPKFQHPSQIQNIQVDVLMDVDIKGVFCASPDNLKCIPTKLEYEINQQENGQHIQFQVPVLEIWTLIWMELV